MEFLRLPGLGPLDKLRLGAHDRLRVARSATASAWSASRSTPGCGGGRATRTFEQFWKPLLRAKLGDAYRSASAAFIWATIQRLYAARRSGLKKEMFGYVAGGYARVLDRLGAALTAEGVEAGAGRTGAAHPARTATSSPSTPTSAPSASTRWW